MMKVQINNDVYNVRFAYDKGKFAIKGVKNGRSLRGMKCTDCIITMPNKDVTADTPKEERWLTVAVGHVRRAKAHTEVIGGIETQVPADTHDIEKARKFAFGKALIMLFPTPNNPFVDVSEEVLIAKTARRIFWDAFNNRKTGPQPNKMRVEKTQEDVKDKPETEVIRIKETSTLSAS